MQYPGLDGFLGTRASFMMDFVSLAMLAILPVLAWSVRQVQQGRYAVHKRTQVLIGIVLLGAVAAFEVDVRFISGWVERAAESRYYKTGVYSALFVHLIFSVSTAPLWIYVIWQALRKIPNPPGPSAYSRSHRFWGKLAAIDMFLTALTGWVFYYVAFVA